jgi:hypothetical protein
LKEQNQHAAKVLPQQQVAPQSQASGDSVDPTVADDEDLLVNNEHEELVVASRPPQSQQTEDDGVDSRDADTALRVEVSVTFLNPDLRLVAYYGHI